MALTVKNKIWLGTLFLFLLLLITGGTGIYYTIQLKDQAKAVLRDNYETISYAGAMSAQLDSMFLHKEQSIMAFDSILALQESNITEPGEKEATLNLRKRFEQLRNGDTAEINMRYLRSEIRKVASLNMEAINGKSIKATQSANEAFQLIIGITGLMFLLALTFMVNFPSVITDPVNKFTEAIREISRKKYEHRIHIERQDEFGQMADAFNEMAERLQAFESSNLNKLMFEKNRAEAVINSLKDASIGIDKEDRILFANEQALQLLGIKAGEFVGKKLADVIQKNDLLRHLVNDDSKAPFKIVVNNKENYFIREIVEVNQGDTENKVIVIKNITSFKELDVAKTNFIATISHEIKTPLASSDFSLQLLNDSRTGELNAEQKELVNNIVQDNQRILKILSELLNMSQVESGRIQLKQALTHPEEIVRLTIETLSQAAKDKHLKIETSLSPALKPVMLDAEKTTWVLNNLLSNAIKYSYTDGVIEIEVHQKEKSIVFCVKDYGRGIPKEYQSRLFEKYFQVPGSISKGTGLGLAISKEFIEAQRGKIEVESEPGKGTIFRFELPVS